MKMNCKHAIIFWMTFFFPVMLFAQSRLHGKISDENGKALSYVSVVLLQDSVHKNGTVSDESGNFILISSCDPGKKYTLLLSSLGFQSFSYNFIYPDTAFMSRLILKEDKSTLAGVTVTGRKPLIDRRSDRYIINVENSFLANGSSGLEVLQRSPGIWVGNDGSIRIKGNQAVMVMINDVVQRMSPEDLAEYLKTLKSEDISKIEVIQNPPSEFEAAGAGGIIHIILKKTRRDGLNGFASMRYRQIGKKTGYGGSGSIDYKVKNLYLFGSISVLKEKSTSTGSGGIIYPDKSIYNTTTARQNDDYRQQYRLGMGYDLGKDQSIGIQVLGTMNKLLHLFGTDVYFQQPAALTTGQVNSEWWRKPSLSSTTFNYSWRIDSLGSTLKLIGDYTGSKREEVNTFLAFYTDPAQDLDYRNSTPNTTGIYSVQADYTKVLKSKLELKAGVKYSSIKRDNELIKEDHINNDWIFNEAASNHFIYRESLLMFYSSAEKRLHNTSVKVGLRGEETYSKGNSITSGQDFSKKYFGLFPSVFIKQTLDESKGNSAYISYARRLQRPGFNELNPYRLQFTNFTVMIGNPDLLPQYTHNIQAGYVFRDNYSADVYFSTTSNLIAQLANPVNNNVIEYQYRNFNTSKEYGMSFNAAFTLLEGWTANNSLSVYNSLVGINGFENGRTSLSLKSTQTVSLKKIMDIDIAGEYRSPYVDANSRADYILYTDLALTRRIIHNKIRLRLYISDIFNTAREKSITEYNNTVINSYQKRVTRTASLFISYSFNSGKKFNAKKIDPNNTEERDRIGN